MEPLFAEKGRRFLWGIEPLKGHDFYVDGLWDAYRSLHFLQMLDVHQQKDMMRSYIRIDPKLSSANGGRGYFTESQLLAIQISCAA